METFDIVNIGIENELLKPFSCALYAKGVSTVEPESGCWVIKADRLILTEDAFVAFVKAN